MLDPNYLLHISEGAEDIAEKLHNQIIKRMVERIMLRIGRGDNYILTAQDKWQIQTLQDAGFLLEDIQRDIAKATKLQQTEIAEAMEDAGVKALSYDDRIYQEAGITTVPLTESPQLIRLMQRNYEATLGEWTNFTRTTADTAQRLFVNELDRAYNLVATGAMSYTQAVKNVVKNIVSNGVQVDYPTGHTDTIETATLRAVRTGISQATAQIQVARMAEHGVDLVITSSHLGARPSHQLWQGQIFSRSGKGKYPNFVESTGYGSVTGLCGANCRHSFSPYFEGMDNPFEHFDSEENLKQYEKEQYQRTLERRIRKTKREVMGLKESVDGCKDDKLKFELDMDYQRKSALLAKQNAAYKDYCERNNLRSLSDRLQIAKWDRKQAAAARGAAKRYENAHGGSVAKEKIIKTDIDDYLDFRKQYELNISKLQQLEKENDELFDAFNMATDAKEESRLEKIWESKYDELSKFQETVKDLKATLSGKEAKAVREIEKNLASEIGVDSSRINMDGMPFDSANMVRESYKTVLKKYSELKNNLAGFDYTKNFSKGAYASCELLSGKVEAHGIFGNFEKLIKTYSEDIAKGFHTVGTDHRSIIVHELGHALDGYMAKKRLLGADFNQFGIKTTASKTAKDMTLKLLGFDRQEIAIELKNQGMKVHQRWEVLDKMEKDFITTHVSEYASESEREFFAECFAEYMMSDNPREAARIFGEIINTALGR